jgi:hypothetical protein
MNEKNKSEDLTQASFDGRLDLVRSLVEAGVDIAAEDSEGITPLQLAKRLGFDALHLNAQSGVIGGDSRFARLPNGNHPRKARPHTVLVRVCQPDFTHSYLTRLNQQFTCVDPSELPLALLPS